MAQKNTVIVLVLICTVIIDVMGMGLVFPLMPDLFLTKGSVFVHGNHATHYFYYAVALGVWPLGLFFGPPLLGDASDKYGRKIVLTICLFMMVVTYLLGGFAIQYGWMWIFFLSRFLSGFFAGSYTLGQAAMVDIAPDNLRSRYLGWITMAASIGIVIGPMITSLTAGTHMMKWFTMQTPMYVAAFVSFMNMLSVKFLLPETDSHKRDVHLSIMNAVKTCVGIFTDKRTRILGIAFLFMQVGWGFYMTDLPVILSQLFHLDVKHIGYFFAVIGISVLVGVLVVQPIMLKYFKLKGLTISMLVITAIIMSMAAVFEKESIQWLVVFFATIPELVAYTASLTLLSKCVNDNEQGRIMGGTGAIYGLSWVVNAILFGMMSNYGIYTPLLVGCGSFVVGGIIVWFWKPCR